MQSVQIIRQSDFTVTPWKNGGGLTREALRVPPSGDPFRWRVSIARIERSGPFSEFAAYHRIMVLLEGNGVALKFGNGEERVLRQVGEVAKFDGAVRTQCDLIDGPCMDFNLIAAKSLEGVHARVQRLREVLQLPLPAGQSTLLLSIDAPLVLEAGQIRATLAPWDLAVIAQPAAAGAGAAAATLAAHAVEGSALVFLATVPDP